MLFTFRKLISRLLFPVPIALLIGVVGLIVLFRARRRVDSRSSAVGAGLLVCAIVFLAAAATAPVADSLLWSLERRHEPLTELPADTDFIVVLGAGHFELDSLGPLQRLGDAGRARVVEAVRLARLHENSRPESTADATVDPGEMPASPQLLFTGYAGAGRIPTAEVAAQAAVALGIPPERTTVLGKPRDTAGEAEAVAAFLLDEADAGSGLVVLVTSASHMPRAVRLFEHAGIAVTPAPTGYQAAARDYTIWGLIPSAAALQRFERAWYELLGLAWASISVR